MISKFSVRKPYTIFVAVIIVLIFGIISLTRMTPDLFPNINTPYVIVMTADPGASAEEAETEITEPVEQQLATLSNIKNVTSVSGDNYSMVALEFTDDVNMDAISVDIRDKLDQIRDTLPENAASPVVMKINMDSLPVVIAAVSMKDKTPAEVSAMTRDELISPLDGIEGVASVSTMGMIDDGLQVKLSQEAIDDLNSRVRAAINGEINDGKNKVRKGIRKAKKGKNQVEDGKDKIERGQEKVNEAEQKASDGIRQLSEAKAALMAQKQIAQAQLAALQQQVSQMKQYQADLDSGDPEKVLAAVHDMAEAGMLSDEQMQPILLLEEAYRQALESGDQEQIDAAAQNITAMGTQIAQTLANPIAVLESSTIPQTQQAITQLDSGIEKIEGQIQDIEDKMSDVNAYTLSNGYADLSSAGSVLDLTISQLEQTLDEIEDGRDKALDGADLNGIITMDNVKAILAAQNFSMPAGYVKDGEEDVLVTVGDKITEVSELENLILFDLDIDGIDPIRVRDIASVAPAEASSDTYAKINGENGVLLTFTKQSTYATATVADNVTDKFEALEKQYKGLHFTALSDQGEYIHTVIDSVLHNLLMGGVLAILILLFFLRDIRPTIITAVSIPVSVIFALALMYFSGVTLNMISLSGLAIGVGMLVDNSIVVIENTYRLRSMGYTLVQSAVSGAVQVAGAITASTLTTICVFAPIVFIDGMTRDIFMDLALTVAYSLIASLIIALTLVPAMAKGMLVRKPKKTVLGQKGRVITRYRGVVAWALHHKAIVLIGAIVLLFASSGLLLSRGFEYMPSMSTPQISASIQMPERSTLKETAAVNDAIMEDLRKVDGVETVGAMLSSDTLGVMGMSAVEQDVTETTMYIVLDESKTDNARIISRKLKQFEKKYNCTIQSSADMDISSYTGGSDISIDLYSEDLDDLRNTAEAVEARMGEMRSLEDVSDITEIRTNEIHISIDKNEAMTRGLSVAQVYQQIAAKLKEEDKATKMKQDGTTVDVSIENATKGLTRQELESMELTADKTDGTKEHMELGEIAVIEDDASLTQINHTGQKRSVTVTAAVKDGYNVTHVTSQLENIIDREHLLRDGVTADFGGQNEEIMHAMKQLLEMMIVGLLLVYLIMVAQFQSLRSPFIVIFSIPLAFTGGMLALLVCNHVMSVVSMFGRVMLMGIVVNNAIVLVDCVNRFRLEGMELDEAIINAGAVRMRPVIMTAATTVLGLIPLAAGIGNGAEMVQPLAIVCIGGLLYATVTTLLVIPVMYRIIAKKHMEKIEDEELEIVTV